MNILLLGEKTELLTDAILREIPTAIFRRYDEPIDINFINSEKPDFVISFGYRHIVSADIINYFGRKIINLHISYLPYNRGSDPNLWSILEDTTKGVTIHEMSAKLDAGDILLRKEVFFNSSETLRSSYDILINEIVNLFSDNCVDIFNFNIEPISQSSCVGGGYHSLKDKIKYEHLTAEKGYDTPICELIGKAK